MADDIRRVPMAQIEAGQTLGANKRETVYLVILRSALPSLMDTCRITLGWAWTYLVVAEIVSANEGLGYSILKAQRFLQTDKIFAGIIVIGVIGLVQDQLLRQARRLVFPYLQR
jgi:NitT/TauT family transport system permease protein